VQLGQQVGDGLVHVKLGGIGRLNLDERHTNRSD
jgi:hypothetical protein